MNAYPRNRRVLTSLAVAGLFLTGCSAPVGTQPSAAGVEVSTEIGPDPVTIEVRVNADQEAMWDALVAGFEQEYPSVTVELTTEAFDTLQANAPRYLSAGEVPDLLRLAVPGDTVKDGLLLDLDNYADAWQWNEFPSSQLDQWRIAADGSLGSGPLYAMGAGFGLVGVYSNADKLAALSISDAPSTIDELEAALSIARDAGEVPMTGDASYILQMLIHAYGGADVTRDWINNSADASIDIPAAVTAANTLQRWASEGYLPADLSSTDGGTALGGFLEGESVFFVQGSWFAGAIDAADGEYDFVLPPTMHPSESVYSMSASNSMVIPAGARHPNEAAAFLDWIQRPDGQRILMEAGGLAPGGLGPIPQADLTERPVFGQTIAGFEQLGADNGIVGFLANASAGFSERTLSPQLDLLLSGRITAERFVEALQADHEATARP